MHVLNYWVGPTIKALPEAYGMLLDALRAAMLEQFGHNDFRAFPDGPTPTRTEAQSHVHAAYLHLLKVGRKEARWDILDEGEGCEEVSLAGRVSVSVSV